MLKTIGTFILIYLIFRVFTTYILPFIVKWYLNRVKKKFYRDNPHLTPDDQKNEGEMTISYKKGKKRPESDNMGEYTDFEEIKEE
jgi:hypothetical protein